MSLVIAIPIKYDFLVAMKKCLYKSFMSKPYCHFLFMIFVWTSVSHSQYSNWRNYTTGDTQISSIADTGEEVWVGGVGTGLVQISKDGTMEYFDKSNSQLPSMTITTIIYANEQLWIGTDAGLANYNGSIWKTYNVQNSPIPSNLILSLHVDNDNKVWIGTPYGLATLDEQGWEVFTNTNSPIPNNEITAITKSRNGNVWLGSVDTYNNYWALVSKTDDSWQIFTPENSGLPDDIWAITALAVDSLGYLWIGGNAGLIKFNGENWQIYDTENSEIPGDKVHSITVARNGRISIGVASYLSIFEDGLWTSYHLPNPILPPRAIVDNLDNIWVGGNNGLLNYREGKWQIYDVGNSSLTRGPFWSVAADKNGKIWIGASEHLLTLDNEEISVEIDTTGRGSPETIIFDHVNTLWAGWSGGGVSMYEGHNWRWFNTDNSLLPNNCIYTIAIDEENRKWVGTDDGLVSIDNDIWTIYTEENSELKGNSVRALTIDSNNHVWIGTNRGLSKFDGINWEFYDNLGGTVYFSYITAMTSDEKGNLYLSPTWDGLIVYDGNNWSVFDSSNSGLPNDYISSLVYDKQGFLNIGTRGGYAKFDGNVFETYDVHNSGLSSNEVRSIAVEEKGNRWFATGCCLDFQNDMPSSVSDGRSESRTILLSQNYPNPFNSTTRIEYEVLSISKVQVVIFDVLGQIVRVLVNKEQTPGHYQIRWDGSSDNGQLVSTGVYFYRLTITSGSQESVITKKLLFLK